MHPQPPTRIPADHGISIDAHPDHWQVSRDGVPVFVAGVDGLVRLDADFAVVRRLPANGLPVSAIRQVVLGWSPRLKSWQLGVLFTPEFAEQRGNRWLELAVWHDPDGQAHLTPAEQAGEALAALLGLSFRLIPPLVEAPPLPPLPITFGDWQVESYDGGLRFNRLGSWARVRYNRIFWHTLSALAFTAVSVLSLTVELGLPSAGTLLPLPQLLPYMALGVVAILVALIARNVLELRDTPDRLVVPASGGTVTGYRSGQRRWEVSSNDVQGVYVTEVAQQSGSRRLIQHVEVNLWQPDGSFAHLLTSETEYEVAVPKPKADTPREVTPLSEANCHTPAQAAALYLSKALGALPSYYDPRRG
ncbi:MAG: hypothetical protein MUF38_08240 [Anaerolineae bacterium]|jgi:hypothetical protein|nr:hypothetical protein [Anaerolineae bacterium]